MEGISTMQLLTIKELMSFLKVKRNTVYELRKQGLPVIHLGRSVRFERDDVINWVRSHCSVNTKGTQGNDNQVKLKTKALPVNKNSRQSSLVGALAILPTENQINAEYLL